MSPEEIFDEEVLEEDEEEGGFVKTTRKVLLAAIGAVALAQEEIEAFVNKLVERGEIAEKDGKKLINEMMEHRKKFQKKTEGETKKQMDSILERMDVPTKADIESLSKKISELSAKIDELQAAEEE
jgi:poly(hydroxyalkanoate) granule-associated protein